MEIATFFSWLTTSALLLARALAVHYTWKSPQSRSGKVVFSILLLSFAGTIYGSVR